MSWQLSPCNFRVLFCKMYYVVCTCYWQICREKVQDIPGASLFPFLSESRLFKLFFPSMKYPSVQLSIPLLPFFFAKVCQLVVVICNQKILNEYILQLNSSFLK